MISYPYVLPFIIRHFNATTSVKSRSIFIDVGGNVGDSLQWFYDYGSPMTPLVPGQPPSAWAFDEIYVWEPNPDYRSKYDELKRKGLKFKLIQAAATDKIGTMFFSGTGLGGAVSVTGQVQVKTLDFSRWLRQISTPEDFVMCKIDAEGSEYVIVKKMLADGTLCLCDRMSIEWHAWVNGTHFNNPRDLMGELGPSAGCNIPHLKKPLPALDCTLPYLVQRLRQLYCPHPLEKWW